MKPTKFKECNVTFAKDQPEYNQLPAFMDEKGEVVTCWKFTFRERLRILLKGEVWLCLLTFNQPLTPSFMSTKKTDVLETNDVS